MHRLAFLALLATTIPLHAQQSISQKDLDLGWILLFDGDSTFGWTPAKNSKGKVDVDGGVLTLDPETGPVFLDCNTHFNSFEISLDYRLEPGAKGKVPPAAGIILTRNARREFFTFVDNAPKKQDWVQFGHRVELVPQKKIFQYVSTFTQDRMIFQSSGAAFPAGLPATNKLTLFATPGYKVQLRKIMLRPRASESLFSGKDLKGWKVFPDKKSTFAVVDGAINVKDGPGDLQTTQKFGDFMLQLDCISNGKHLNSGIFFRCKPNEYQNGYEAQIRNQFTDKLNEYTVENYDPETHKLVDKLKIKSPAVDFGTGAIYRRMPARKALSEDGKWFAFTIVAHRNHFATWVNGIQQVDWTDNRPLGDNPRTACRLEPGHISIQGHDPTTDLSFKNFRITKIKQ